MSNNAANSIDAKSKKLMELLFKKKYQVKYFQREYKWQKNNIEDLIVDLERSFMSNYSVENTRDSVPDYDCYYMGPVVLYREKTTFVIVDGQQRLTSFTLLLIYLIHLQNEVFKLNPKKIQNLQEYVFSQPFESETLNLEIPEREPILKALFEGADVLESYIENESSQNIFDRYNDIADLFPITLKHEARLPLFINWLTEKLIFIEILAQTSDSAYTIFESMNDRGLRLTQTELLKSYLLSNVKDDAKIKELDYQWKKKIAIFKTFSNDEDELFFKAWLRAKYAVSIRPPEKGATNQDFEKIGTRFSNWVQDIYSKKILGLDTNNPETFFFFVHSDFHFFSDLYLKISDYELSENSSEHKFKLISYKGISASLSYPFILSPITKIDDEETIDEKTNLCVSFLDSFAIYRVLLNQAITQSSVDYFINRMIRDIRNNNTDELKEKFKKEIDEYKNKFLHEVDYIKFDTVNSKYILSRLYKSKHNEIPFENIYLQRRRDSFALYQFLTFNDVEIEVHKIPQGLKDIFIEGLCSYVIVPKQIIHELGLMNIAKRIQYLIRNKYLFEFDDINDFDPENLRDFFMKRNKKMKEQIINYWKI
jgi:uncharacterized protein with ParB-like and HNH nuclease domain